MSTKFFVPNERHVHHLVCAAKKTHDELSAHYAQWKKLRMMLEIIPIYEKETSADGGKALPRCDHGRITVSFYAHDGEVLNESRVFDGFDFDNLRAFVNSEMRVHEKWFRDNDIDFSDESLRKETA